MRLTPPNFRHLRVFREVALCRSVSVAAERAHLSQPAVTQAVAKLEKELKVPLFERRRDGMYVTEIGAVFLRRVESALDHLMTGTREAARLGAREKGRGFVDFDRLLTAAQLRALVAVSEAKNFSMAARNIGISQPSIHRAARNLERLSGLKLFESAHEGISLTPAAHVLAQRTKLALAELQQGFDEIDDYLGQDSTHIVVGALPLARTHLLPTAIDLMVRNSERVQIRAVDGRYDELLHGVRQGDLDFLVGALRHPAPVDDIIQEPLFDDPLAIVAGPQHPLARKSSVTLEDMLEYPWVAPPKSTPAGSYLYDTLRIGQLPRTPVRVVSSSLVLLRGLLTTGNYITIISLNQIRHEYEQGVLVPLPIELADSARTIGLTYRRDWRPTRTQRQFLSYIRTVSGMAYGDPSALSNNSIATDAIE
ncbi:LysR family transcriptional regulator [Oricola thermophila]|uniref:LysR family transcriptional regulator n=1 Tax=Oricola thermophila TaxID=2742145 RepID=A0A6N1V8G7_9HYPH|nr:LysR family transcriptional regulator [Oricola thermophila]QKV16978.1 LysR family transcriptional regulator [Oricola thermophila]